MDQIKSEMDSPALIYVRFQRIKLPFYFTEATELKDLHMYLLKLDNIQVLKEFRKKFTVYLIKTDPESGQVKRAPLGKLINVVPNSENYSIHKSLSHMGVEAGDEVLIVEEATDSAHHRRNRSRSPVYKENKRRHFY